MKQNKNYLTNVGVLLASVSSLFVLATAPVYATDAGQTDTTTTTSSDSGTPPSTDSGSTNTGDVATSQMHTPGDWSEQAKQEVTALREGKGPGRPLATLKQICENHQTAITNKLAAFNNSAAMYMTRLNDLFTKVQAYQASKQLKVSNYDTLVATVKAKQTAAQTAVNALKTLQVTCNTNDPAASFATVKDGAAATRDALKAYRSALKDLVVALLQANGQASSGTTNTTTGGN